MKHTFLIIIYILLSINLLAVDQLLPVSAGHNATNNLSLLLDSPSISNTNPALSYPGAESSVTHLFGLNSLPLYNLHLSWKFSNFGIHLGNTYLNHTFYQENNTQITLNYHLPAISIGVAGRNLYSKAEKFHQKSTFIIDSGLYWSNKNIKSAFSIKNINQSSLLNTELPIIYLWETSVSVSNQSKLAIALEKEKNFDFSFKLAASYTPFRVITILAGYQYEPDRLGLGIVFKLSKWQITYSTRTHQYLNLTHYISVCHAFNN